MIWMQSLHTMLRRHCRVPSRRRELSLRNMPRGSENTSLHRRRGHCPCTGLPTKLGRCMQSEIGTITQPVPIPRQPVKISNNELGQFTTICCWKFRQADGPRRGIGTGCVIVQIKLYMQCEIPCFCAFLAIWWHLPYFCQKN